MLYQERFRGCKAGLLLFSLYLLYLLSVGSLRNVVHKMGRDRIETVTGEGDIKTVMTKAEF